MITAVATRRELYLALGFLAVLLKDQAGPPADAAQARQIAGLLEEFCGAEQMTPLDGAATGKFTVAQAMARAMCTHIIQHGICERADMMKAGFSGAEITRYWDMASALAHVQMGKATALD